MSLLTLSYSQGPHCGNSLLPRAVTSLLDAPLVLKKAKNEGTCLLGNLERPGPHCQNKDLGQVG